MSKVVLKLYVAGHSHRSESAIANLRKICDGAPDDLLEMDVVDVLARPDLGIREQILVTPTLIRESPPPAQRIVGDLSDPDKVLVWLDIEHSQAI